MKLFVKSLSAGLILTILFSLIPFAAQCEIISDELFRLHILANSDSEADQELKLRVRDKVLQYTEEMYADCRTKEDVITATSTHLGGILQTAQNQVRSLGYNYKVHGKITKMYFNTRTYGDYTIPSGRYDALEITIGRGKGHNWWCVMYPSFCIGESKCIDDRSLSPGDKKIISDDSQYKVKFKIVELYEKILDLF